jgi:hypothetical protein
VLTLFGISIGEPVQNAPEGWEWWGMFLFLIPFEVIGLAMFAVLCVVLLEPFRRTTLRFEPYRIVKHSRWPIFRHTRQWEVVDLERLELRLSKRKKRDSTGTVRDPAGETPYSIAFVSRTNADLCEIDNLTEAEARWIARHILERRANWFGGRN